MQREFSPRVLRKRRVVAVVFIVLALLAGSAYESLTVNSPQPKPEVLSDTTGELAIDVLEQLPVKGRAPKAGYVRSQFGSGWAEIEGCDMRNIILARDLRDVKRAEDGCTVLSGSLADPYTAMTIDFVRGAKTSSDVQIDHVVALSDAWQKGAQQLDELEREIFANDPLNLLAVQGEANQRKGDSDAATWLPSNRSYRCQYVARQIAVKKLHKLWVTEAEKAAMKRVLNGCEKQAVPS
jgi:hypothetical protein